MQNQNTITTTRAALIARRERALADFCQLALDDRSAPEGLSEDARAEMNALEEELASIHQQLREQDEAELPASGEQPAEQNEETRAVIAWLSDEIPVSDTARAIVAEAWNTAAATVASDRDAIVTPRADAAESLSLWVSDEECPLVKGASLYGDLLSYALARVNWYAVAQHFQPDPLPSIEPIPYDDGEEDAEQPEEPEGEWREWLQERD